MPTRKQAQAPRAKALGVSTAWLIVHPLGWGGHLDRDIRKGLRVGPKPQVGNLSRFGAQAARRAGFDIAVYAYGSSLVRGQPKETAQTGRISVPEEGLGGTQTADALAGIFQDQEKRLLNSRRYPRGIILHLTDGELDEPHEVKDAVRNLIRRGMYVATLGIDLDPHAISHVKETYPVWANVRDVGHIDDALMAIGRTIMRQRQPTELKRPAAPVFTPQRLRQRDLDWAGAGVRRRHTTRRRTPV